MQPPKRENKKTRKAFSAFSFFSRCCAFTSSILASSHFHAFSSFSVFVLFAFLCFHMFNHRACTCSWRLRIVVFLRFRAFTCSTLAFSRFRVLLAASAWPRHRFRMHVLFGTLCQTSHQVKFVKFAPGKELKTIEESFWKCCGIGKTGHKMMFLKKIAALHGETV